MDFWWILLGLTSLRGDLFCRLLIGGLADNIWLFLDFSRVFFGDFTGFNRFLPILLGLLSFFWVLLNLIGIWMSFKKSFQSASQQSSDFMPEFQFRWVFTSYFSGFNRFFWVFTGFYWIKWLKGWNGLFVSHLKI